MDANGPRELTGFVPGLRSAVTSIALPSSLSAGGTAVA